MRHRRPFRLVSLPLLWCVAASSAHAELRVPDDYDTIQDAINAIAANPLLDNSVLIAAGTYEEELTLIDNLTLRGEETARVLLRATDGDGTVITGERVSNVSIRNLTFIGGGIGVALTNAINISILNNVFNLGDDQIAIDLPDDSTVDVVHNTFYDTGTAVRRVGSFAVIENNIFAFNQTAIATPLAVNVDYNLFYENTATDVFGDHDIVDLDPLFANIDVRDFHLREDSPAIDEGNLTGTDAIDDTRADLGAYGGAYAEATPFPPQSVSAVDASAAAGESAIDVSWVANLSYLVTNNDTPGGYRVYYDSDASGEPYESRDATNGDSPIDVGDVQTVRLTGLAAANVTPDAPVISAIEPGPQRLTISWGAVTSATRYNLYYGTASVNDNMREVGNVTSYTLEGLTDGVSYQVAVTALNQPTYYIAVTAYDSFPEAERHESDYSTEQVVTLGTLNESAQSAIGSGIPEIPVAYPNLPNEGCFIATAAYGYYDASEVRLLRRFRDDFLLTQDWGRQFVAWYYAHSPRAANVIRDNASLRAAARIALLPVIGLTRIATAPHPLMHALPLFAFLAICLAFIRMRTTHRTLPRARLRAVNAGLVGIALVAPLTLTPTPTYAADEPQPHYSFALTAGAMRPDTPDWSTYYSDDTPREFSLALGWKPLRFLEIGAEASYFGARGEGYLPLNDRTGGQVVHEVAPVGVYAVLRGQWTFDQLLVPYIGAGVSRVYYQQSIAGAGQNHGKIDGHSVKAGLQISLDRVDPTATRTLRGVYGIEHVSFIVEYVDATAVAKDVNGVDTELLGRSTRFGLLFEY